MNIAIACLLGIVQGLTEFLPVSSTAHLYIVQSLLGIRNDEVTLSFDVVLHLGTVAALFLVFARELLAIFQELLLWISGRPARDPEARAVILPLVVGTIPGVLAGLFLLKRIEKVRTLGLIGVSMLVACAFFLFAEWKGARAPRQRGLPEITIADALWIGIAQAAAGLMAGFSRSGFTISTGRLRGFERPAAARFSFLLALPIILGAGAKALLDLRKAHEPISSAPVLAAGFLCAAVVGFLVVRFLLRYLRTNTLRPFAYYLGGLGLVLLAVSFTRWREADRAVVSQAAGAPAADQPPLHLLARHGAGLLVEEQAALDDREVRNAANSELLGELRVFLRVHLQDEGAPRHLRGGLRDLGSGDLAGPAPGRPEVHQHRHLRVAGDLAEDLRVRFDGLSDRRDLRLAVAAAPLVGQPLGRRPVLLPAGRT